MVASPVLFREPEAMLFSNDAFANPGAGIEGAQAPNALSCRTQS